jgi:ribonuclease HI
MTTYLPKWIQNGFLTSSSTYPRGTRNGNGNGRAHLSNTPVQKVKNADMIKHLLVLLRRRGPGNGVKFKYVPGHSGWEGNEAADVSEGDFRLRSSSTIPTPHPI